MSSALSMFRKTASHGDIRKSAQKVADPRKDTVTRLKHLRSVLENYDAQEAKRFFQDNYSHIYYIFYDNFGVVEADLKQKTNKTHREELESILHIFEKILFLLPELIHKRWMFHSIGRVMKKLLHPGNSVKLRREGMRLFIVWYQILQENASDECHNIFLQLVPGIGDGEHQDILNNAVPTTPDTCSGMIAAGEVTAILPGVAEKLPENITKYFLDALLTVMVSEVIKIEWMNKEMRETSFVFLFNKFKGAYLQWLLPEFEKRDIYEPVLELPRVRSVQEMMAKDDPANVSECRDSFIRWLANFTITTKKPDTNLIKGISCSALTDGPNPEDGQDSSETKGSIVDQMPGSNTSTLSAGSVCIEKDSANSSQCSDDHSLSEYEIVRTVLYSTRENVNIVHECFRQALLFSFKHAVAMRKVIGVYKEWFQHAEQRPVFMQEPGDTGSALDSHCETPEFHHSSLSDIVEEEISSDESLSASASSIPRQTFLTDGIEKPKYIRNASYLGAVQELADHGEQHQYDVRAGMQKVLQVFITNAANIFLLDTEDDNSLQEQVYLCKSVLNIYRHVVMNLRLNQKTWEQILQVLLCITSGVLKPKPPKERHKSLGGRLAQAIFQTLIVTWIKANLNVLISSELWNEFLNVLSSLTSWSELVNEWAKTMETLTRVLARQVYGLDLTDLPLARLSEQKEKRRRGKSQDGSRAKSTERSFSRGWSRGDGQVANSLRSSTNSAPLSDSASFERGRNKSDGAGGSRSRPDLHKQRSLSGEPSPAHSRSASTASDIIVRSSSEGNIADPKELIEKLRGASFNSETSRKSIITACDAPGSGAAEAVGASAAIEDHEVADITTTCHAELASVASGFSNFSQDGGPCDLSADSISLDKSDSETVVIRTSRTPSPVSIRSKSGSRTPSPTSELTVDNQHKDSPTPDRDSLHIDMMAGPEENTLSRDSLDEFKSVMAGGTVSGWMPDVAVVLWRRMLSCLGDVNKIEDPKIHETVYDYLCDLFDTLIRMRENLGVTQDNVSSPPPPDLIPPHQIFITWLFECFTLSSKYKRGKVLAYQLICQMLVCRHDVPPSMEVLCQFYHALHSGLVSLDQDVINVLVRNCGARYFSLPLPGTLLLMLDFIHAAGTIISTVDVKVPPREEAVTLLGALLCFPNHFGEMPVLQPNSVDKTVLNCIEMKDHIVNLLLKAGKREPAGLARCIAVSSVGIFLYEELTHGTHHLKIKEAVHVLLGAIRCGYHKVAMVGSDMLLLLCDHAQTLLENHPLLPKTIVEFIAQTISTVLQSHETSGVEEERLIVSLMFCMVEWCMNIPMPLLMEATDTEKSCIYKVFRVLHSAVTGHSASSLSRASKSLADFMQDLDNVDSAWETQSSSSGGGSPKLSASDAASESATEVPQPSQVPDAPRKPETDIVKLAARTLMTHLVNHLCHFPTGSGAARLNTTVQEHHDIPDYIEDDLKPEIFTAPHVQFFVLNHKALISFVELPAVDAPGGGVTAGLSTARTVCRVIVRDLNGKACWESSVLYSPPWCKKGSSVLNAQTLLGMTSDMELEPLIIQEESDLHLPDPAPKRPATQLPLYEHTQEQDDNLDDLLRYIGHASPECLLHPGKPLNIPAPIPVDFVKEAENMMTDMVLNQKVAELEYYNRHKADVSMLAKPQMPMEIQDPVSPFQMCRLVLDQMGLLSWEKRCHIDLLKKSDKLLRELKNLDNQMCRETHKIAVIYVAAGQEDRNSILSNSGASEDFESFVSGLGWEVDLETHQGFRGGLQPNKTTGCTAPYYANSTCEVIFHVSTRIPSGNDESRHIKMRHLGNDEVHIIWSEHFRDYRRGIIPTEFGDVLIVIYPLPNGLCRIQINKKPEVPVFGPLFDGAILDQKVLPGLVRATAINASRVKRSHMPFFHSFYEERAKCLETIIQLHLEHTTFEDFAANVFAPVLPSNATIVDATLPSESSSGSLSELLTTEQSGHVSPTGLRHGRANDSALLESPKDQTDSRFVRTARRLSMKGRKSSTSKSSSTAVTPPGSPKAKNKK